MLFTYCYLLHILIIYLLLLTMYTYYLLIVTYYLYLLLIITYYLLLLYIYSFIYLYLYLFIYLLLYIYTFSFYTICNFTLTLVSIDYLLLNTRPGISWRCRIGSAMGPGCLDLLLQHRGRDHHPRRMDQMGEPAGLPGGHLSRDQPKRQQHPASSST